MIPALIIIINIILSIIIRQCLSWALFIDIYFFQDVNASPSETSFSHIFIFEKHYCKWWVTWDARPVNVQMFIILWFHFMSHWRRLNRISITPQCLAARQLSGLDCLFLTHTRMHKDANTQRADWATNPRHASTCSWGASPKLESANYTCHT